MDGANLQFTVPAPDPAQAGETVLFQALAINTGTDAWPPGSYYWVAEVYDLDHKYAGRSRQVTPQETVQAGAVASVSVPFFIPETAVGRRFYRIFLYKGTEQLLVSDYKAFQIVEKPIPPAPEAVDYRIEGNLTLSYKNSSRNKWSSHSGATTLNTVGKIKDSSYLLNAYLLHEPGKVFDPFIIVLNYYAPWGTVSAGDISPSMSPLSVSGLGMRGGMLEQRRGDWSWSLAGGQTVGSVPGDSTTNGRFARTMYAASGRYSFLETLSATGNAFLSADETGSLSNDPRSGNYRGPTLTPQRNSGYGLTLAWEPRPKLSLTVDYEQTSYQADAGKVGAKDSAYRAEFRWARPVFKLKTYLQRTGPKYVSFGAPAVVGDRMTYDFMLELYPLRSYTLSLIGNQYQDNLGGDPAKVTTTQRLVGLTNAFQFPTGTGLSLTGTMNTAKGKPATALDNQTVTAGLNLSQAIKAHSVSLGAQMSQFKDKNKLAHDLDTQTLSFSSNLALPARWNATFGASRTLSRDKVDGSQRTSLSVSPSLAFPLRRSWTAQIWGSMTSNKSTSPTLAADSTLLSSNSEFTWTVSPQNSLTFGLGYNRNKDKADVSRSYSESTASFRYSLSF